MQAALLDAYFLASRDKNDEVEVVSNGASTAINEAVAEIEAPFRETTSALLAGTADTGALVQRLSSPKARRAELRAVPATVSSTYVPTGRTLRETWDSDDSLIMRRRILIAGLYHLTNSKAVLGLNGLDAGRVTLYRNEGVTAVTDAGRAAYTPLRAPLHAGEGLFGVSGSGDMTVVIRPPVIAQDSSSLETQLEGPPLPPLHHSHFPAPL